MGIIQDLAARTVDRQQKQTPVSMKFTNKLNETKQSLISKVDNIIGVTEKDREAVSKIITGELKQEENNEGAVPQTFLDIGTALIGKLGESVMMQSEITSLFAPLVKDLYETTQSPLLATFAGRLIKQGYKQEAEERAKLVQKANSTLEAIKQSVFVIGDYVKNWFVFTKDHLIQFSQNFISSVDDFFANLLTNTGPLAPLMKLMYPYIKSMILSTFKVSKSLLSAVFSPIKDYLAKTLLAKFLKPKGEDKLERVTKTVITISDTLKAIQKGLDIVQETGLVEVPDQIRDSIQKAVEVSSKAPLEAVNEALDKFTESENEKIANSALQLKKVLNDKKFQAVAGVLGAGALFAVQKSPEEKKEEEKKEKQKLETKQTQVLENISSGIQDLKKAFSKEYNYSDEVSKKEKSKQNKILTFFDTLTNKILGTKLAHRVKTGVSGIGKIFKNVALFVGGFFKNLFSTVLNHPILSAILGISALKFDWIADLSKLAAVGTGLKALGIGKLLKGIKVLQPIFSFGEKLATTVGPILEKSAKFIWFLEKLPVVGSLLSKFFGVFKIFGKLIPGLGWILLAVDAIRMIGLDNIIKGIKWTFSLITGFFSGLWNAAKWVYNKVATGLNTIESGWKTLKSKVLGILSPLGTLFKNIANFIGNPLNYIMQHMGIKVPKITPMSILDTILLPLKPLMLAYKLLPDAVKNFFSKVKKWIAEKLKNIPFIGDKLAEWLESEEKEKTKTTIVEEPTREPELVIETVPRHRIRVPKSEFVYQPPIEHRIPRRRGYAPEKHPKRIELNPIEQKILKTKTPHIEKFELPKELESKSIQEKLLALVRKRETGTYSGKYDIAKILKDRAGVTFGAYQFTEKAGMVQKFLEEYALRTKDHTAEQILAKLKSHTISKKDLMEYLRKIGNTPIARQIQDELALKQYVQPAIKLAKKYGIEDPRALAMVVDHAINAGLGGAKEVLQIYKNLGGKNISQLAQARKIQYTRTATRRSYLAQYLEAWKERVDRNITEAQNLFQKKSSGTFTVSKGLRNVIRSFTEPIKEIKKTLTQPVSKPENVMKHNTYTEKYLKSIIENTTYKALTQNTIGEILRKSKSKEANELLNEIEALAEVKPNYRPSGKVEEKLENFLLNKLPKSEEWGKLYTEFRKQGKLPGSTKKEMKQDLAKFLQQDIGKGLAKWIALYKRVSVNALEGSNAYIRAKFLNTYSSKFRRSTVIEDIVKKLGLNNERGEKLIEAVTKHDFRIPEEELEQAGLISATKENIQKAATKFVEGMKSIAGNLKGKSPEEVLSTLIQMSNNGNLEANDVLNQILEDLSKSSNDSIRNTALDLLDDLEEFGQIDFEDIQDLIKSYPKQITQELQKVLQSTETTVEKISPTKVAEAAHNITTSAIPHVSLAEKIQKITSPAELQEAFRKYAPELAGKVRTSSRNFVRVKQKLLEYVKTHYHASEENAEVAKPKPLKTGSQLKATVEETSREMASKQVKLEQEEQQRQKEAVAKGMKEAVKETSSTTNNAVISQNTAVSSSPTVINNTQVVNSSTVATNIVNTDKQYTRVSE